MGLSQSKFAEKFFIKKETLQKWETSYEIPEGTYNMILKIIEGESRINAMSKIIEDLKLNRVDELANMDDLVREACSRLRVLYTHVLKAVYQTDKYSKSWESSIKESLTRLESMMSTNLDNKLAAMDEETRCRKYYNRAISKASSETGLDIKMLDGKEHKVLNKYTYDDILKDDFLKRLKEDIGV